MSTTYTEPPRAKGPAKVPLFERNTAICEGTREASCSFRTPVGSYQPYRAAQDHARCFPGHKVVVAVYSYYRVAK